MSAQLVPVGNMAAVEALGPEAQALAITNMLGEARAWLAHAVEASEPQSIANFKAQMATVAEATKQLGLSKEIQMDAQEMVRRAERGVGLAIRKGQENGTVQSRTQMQSRAAQIARGTYQQGNNPLVPKPTDLASTDDLTGNGAGIYHLTDGVSDEDFEDAITQAKAEENLSRANVVRKVKSESAIITRRQRADTITDLAARGYSSRQMPGRVGVSEETVRQIARDFDIEIPADKIIGRSKRIDHTLAIESTVTSLDNLVSTLNIIELDQADFTGADEWVSSLTESIAALKRFTNKIKEKTHA